MIGAAACTPQHGKSFQAHHFGLHTAATAATCTLEVTGDWAGSTGRQLPARRCVSALLPNIYASANSSSIREIMQVKPDEDYDWAMRYQGALRSIPLAAGALGICGVLANRVVSGVSGCFVCRLPHCITQLAVPAWDSGSIATAYGACFAPCVSLAPLLPWCTLGMLAWCCLPQLVCQLSRLLTVMCRWRRWWTPVRLSHAQTWSSSASLRCSC